MSSGDEVKDAFYDGRDAFRARKPRSSNPLRNGHTEGWAWNQGWDSVLTSVVLNPQFLRLEIMFAPSQVEDRRAA